MRRFPVSSVTWWRRWSAVAEREEALIALGANLGEPAAALRRALSALASLGDVRRRSKIYRTAPVGGPKGQPDYLNAVIALLPAAAVREPEALLAGLHRIEAELGRTRRIRWEARVLDLDLIALGDRLRDDPDLVLPHPAVMERPFVLVPLLDVAPAWRNPRDGRSAAQVLGALDASGVRPSGLSWTSR